MNSIIYKNHKKIDSGFTLLELLISVFIFSLIAAGAYKVSSVAQEGAVAIQESQNRLRNISLCFELIEKDISQVISRNWRDPFTGSLNPPIETNASNQFVIRMLQGGWRNPLGLPRSELQQVTYKLSENKVLREHTLYPDNISSVTYNSIELLDGVESITMTFIEQGFSQDSSNNQDLNSWPPRSFNINQNSNNNDADGDTYIDPAYPIPIAIEITLELTDFGNITKIISLPVGA